MRAVLLLPVLVACGESAPTSDDGTADTDPPPAAVGLWRTTSDAVDAECSGTPTELAVPVAFRQVVEVEGGLEVRECTATDQCSTTSVDAAVFAPKGEAWQAVARWGFLNTTDSQTACITYAMRQRLVLQPDGSLRGTSETVSLASTEGTASDAACDEAALAWEPEWNGSPFDCKAWEGTREP